MYRRALTYTSKTIRVVNAQAAGTTAVNGSAVDTQGFESCRFVALLGTLTATQVTSIKIQGSDDGSTNWVDMTGTLVGPAADGDGNKILISEIYKPSKRYVRCAVNRATANAVIDGVIAELFVPYRAPVTADTTVSAQEVNDNVFPGTA